MRFFLVVLSVSLAACAGPKLPAPNSADARYDGRDRAVQVMVSNLQPPTAAALVANDGTRYPTTGISLVSGPHVLYNAPPSIGFGIGVFFAPSCVVRCVVPQLYSGPSSIRFRCHSHRRHHGLAQRVCRLRR